MGLAQQNLRQWSLHRWHHYRSDRFNHQWRTGAGRQRRTDNHRRCWPIRAAMHFARLPPQSQFRAEGFVIGTAKADGKPGGAAHLNLQLAMTTVETNVQVNADSTAMDSGSGVGTRTLNAAEIQATSRRPRRSPPTASAPGIKRRRRSQCNYPCCRRLSKRERLPPKSSIASIRVNPDAFSPEYAWPSSQGGRIEITTKPGADIFHGAVFLTWSDGHFNATDPFSVTLNPGKQAALWFRTERTSRPPEDWFFH